MNVRQFADLIGRREMAFHDDGGDAPQAGLHLARAAPVRLSVLAPRLQPPPPPNLNPPGGDVTGAFSILIRRDRHPHAGLVRHIVTVTNVGSAPAPGPISLVVLGLRRGTRLLGPSGFTTQPPARAPYQNLALVGDALQPGTQAVALLRFRTQAATVRYVLRVVAGPGPR